MTGPFSGLIMKAQAIAGQERAGHKYIRRTPKKSGKGFDYVYHDTGAARGAVEGEKVNLRDKGTHEVLKVHAGTVQLRDEAGKTSIMTLGDFHDEMHRAWQERYERGARRLALRYLRKTVGADRGLVSGPKGDPVGWADKVRAAGVDPNEFKALLRGIGKRKGWGEDATTVLREMAGDPLWGKRIVGSAGQVAKGAENLARFEAKNPLADPTVKPEHVTTAALLRFEDLEASAKPGEEPSGTAQSSAKPGQSSAKPGQSEDSDAGMKVERLRLEADRALVGLETILGAIEAAQGNPGVERALTSYLSATAGGKLNAVHELRRAAIAFPGLRDLPELARWQAVRGKLQSLVRKMGYGKDDKGQGIAGTETSVYIANEKGDAVPQKARYRLVDAHDLLPSHDPFRGFQQHPAYPEGVQERVYHKDKGEQEKVLRNAQRLQPDLVINTNPDAANGPPVVTPDGIVLGGNSRVMSLQIVHANDPEKRQAYVQHLRQNAAAFGFAPGDVDQLRSPVLIREVDPGTKDPKALGLLARQYNEAFTQAMDPRTDQVARARRVTDDMIQTLSVGMGDDTGTEPKHATLNAFLSSQDARPFVDSLQKSGIVDSRNKAAYLRPDNTLNEDGKTFVERLLVGKVLPHPDVLGELPQGVFSALSRSVPHILRADSTGHAISTHLLEAAKAYTQARTWKKPPRNVTEWESQGELGEGFGGRPKLGAEAKSLLRVFYERPGERQMPEFFRDTARHAAMNRPGAGDMFGGGKTTAQVLDDVHEGRHKALQRRTEEGQLRVVPKPTEAAEMPLAASAVADLLKAANAGLGRKLHERFRTFAEKVAWIRKHMPDIGNPEAFVAASLREAGHPPEADRAEKSDIRAHVPGSGNPGSRLGVFSRLVLWKAMTPPQGGRGGWSPIPGTKHGGWHRRRGDGSWEQWYPDQYHHALAVREQLSLFGMAKPGPVPRGAVVVTPPAPTLPMEADDAGRDADGGELGHGLGEPEPVRPRPHPGNGGGTGEGQGQGAQGGEALAPEVSLLSSEAVEALPPVPNPVFTESGTDPEEKYEPPKDPAWQAHPQLLPDKTWTLSEAERTFAVGTLKDHQVDNAERILTAWERTDGVLLMDDPGIGKTLTSLAAVRAFGARRVLVVTPTGGKRNLKAQWQQEAGWMGFRASEDVNEAKTVDGLYVTSYDDLVQKLPDPETGKLKETKALRDAFDLQWDVIIFDESHNMKTAKTRAMAALSLQEKARKVAYLSATPFTNVADMHYLRRLGWFRDGRSFCDWAREVGAFVNEKKKGIGDLPYHVGNPSSPLPMAAIAARGHVDGLFLHKRANMKGSTSQFTVIRQNETPEEAARTFAIADEIAEAAVGGGLAGSLVKMNMVSWKKAYWETLKTDRAIGLAEAALREDPRRQVAFFTSYKAFDHGHLRAFPRSLRRRAARLAESSFAGSAALAATMEMAAERIDQLLSEMPPITNPIVKIGQRFGGASKVARVHGPIDGDPSGRLLDPKAEQDAFNAGRKKVAVITMDKGGTGFNWHDKKGDAPRVQVNLSLPWSGTKFTQVSGRCHRLGSMSRTGVHWIVGDDENERHNAAIVAMRLRNAGALTTGDYDKEVSAAALANFDFGEDLDSDEIQEALEAALSGKGEEAGEVAAEALEATQTSVGKQTRDHFLEFAEKWASGTNVYADERARKEAEKKARAEREVRRAMKALDVERGWKALALPNGRVGFFGPNIPYEAVRLAQKHGGSEDPIVGEVSFPSSEGFHAFVVELLGAEKVTRHDPLSKEELEAVRNPKREEEEKRRKERGDTEAHDSAAIDFLFGKRLALGGSRMGPDWVRVGGSTYDHRDSIKRAGGQGGYKWDDYEKVWHLKREKVQGLARILGWKPAAATATEPAKPTFFDPTAPVHRGPSRDLIHVIATETHLGNLTRDERHRKLDRTLDSGWPSLTPEERKESHRALDGEMNASGISDQAASGATSERHKKIKQILEDVRQLPRLEWRQAVLEQELSTIGATEEEKVAARRMIQAVPISSQIAASGPFATLLKAVQFDMFGQHQKVGGGGLQGRQLGLAGLDLDRPSQETFQGKKPPGAGWQPIPGTRVGDGWRRPHPGGGWEYKYEPHRHGEYPHGGKGKPGALVRDEGGIIHRIEKVVRRDSEWHFGVKTPAGDRLIPSRQAKIHRTAEEAGGDLFAGVQA